MSNESKMQVIFYKYTTN